MPATKEPCPFDPTQFIGDPCKHGDRCPYYVRRGKQVRCLGLVPSEMHLAHLVAANWLMGDEARGGNRSH